MSQLNPSISSSIGTGTISLLFAMPGLTNLAGSSQPALNLGVVNGRPVLTNSNPATYSGLSDLDWWYIPNTDELNASGVPTNQLPATIVAGVLNSSAGQFSFVPSPFGTGRFDLSMAVIMATVGASSAPLESTNGFPPGHLPVENISPQLVSFASMSAGKLKGNISAASLAATPVPAPLIGGTEGFTTNNSFLDVLISGYHYVIFQEINPTQPDQADPGAPVAGAGPPYHFSVNTGKVVTGAQDKNGTTVSLSAALNAAAYSAYFTFTADRVIVQSPPAALLTVANYGNKVIMSWPSSLTGWTLQTNNNLVTGTWGNYAGPAINNSVTNSPPTGNLFFRLIRP